MRPARATATAPATATAVATGIVHLALGLATLASLAGCTTEDIVAIRRCTGAACAAPDDRPGYCQQSGPSILLPTLGGSATCAGALATRTFQFALCTCTDYASNVGLSTDSFDSATGPYRAPGGVAAAVGVNGKLESTGSATIRGSLWVAGADLRFGPSLDVSGDLSAAGRLGSAITSVRVGGAARVGSDIEVASLTVAGTLSLPAAATLTAPTQSVGALRREAVTVAPPCPCGAASEIDIAALVEAHRSANHNADIGLGADSLVGFTQDQTRELPCGRYFLSRIDGRAGLTLVITGRVALFIAGDITLTGALRVDVRPGGQLDLFVGTHIDVGSDLSFGSPAAPADARLYVGGGGAINLAGNSVIAGNLYAPRADLVISGGAEVFGALLVQRVVHSAPLSLHHDVAVRRAGDSCPVL